MVYELLRHGEQNARTGRELCSVLRIRPRDLTAAVERERRAGMPICATTNHTAPGYYIATDRAEMGLYCDSLTRRVQAVTHTLEACRRTMEQLPPQGGQANAER